MCYRAIKTNRLQHSYEHKLRIKPSVNYLQLMLYAFKFVVVLVVVLDYIYWTGPLVNFLLSLFMLGYFFIRMPYAVNRFNVSKIVVFSVATWVFLCELVSKINYEK